MDLSIPILYENKPVGALTAEQDGLYTVYTAACTIPGADRLRLSVYGEDREAYLGLMLPDGTGRLTLRKRLTRLERERLPAPALFAAEEHAVFPELAGRGGRVLARGTGRHALCRRRRAGLDRHSGGARQRSARGAPAPA